MQLSKILSSATTSLENPNDIALFFPQNYDYTTIGFFGSTAFGTYIPFQINGLTLVQSYIKGDSTDGYLSAQFQVSNPSKRIVEHYKLAWSAYAITLPVNCDNDLCDLELRYNYRPWKGEEYQDASSSTPST